MFEKILLANRGENGHGVGVSAHCMAREAGTGDFATENHHV